MRIQEKGWARGGRYVDDVYETTLDGIKGYAENVEPYIRKFYSYYAWEPVEEWVTIEVRKEDIKKLVKPGEIIWEDNTQKVYVQWRYLK